MNVQWKEGMHLVGKGENSPVEIHIDAVKEHGGASKGATPKELVLMGLASCTMLDVLSILKKMKIDLQAFSVEVEADSTNEHPKVFKNIYIQYTFYGKGIPEDKVKRAINLSQEKYCGVSEMLRKTANITVSFQIKEGEQ